MKIRSVDATIRSFRGRGAGTRPVKANRGSDWRRVPNSSYLRGMAEPGTRVGALR